MSDTAPPIATEDHGLIGNRPAALVGEVGLRMLRRGNHPQALTKLAPIGAASYLDCALQHETQQAWS